MIYTHKCTVTLTLSQTHTELFTYCDQSSATENISSNELKTKRINLVTELVKSIK